MIYKTQGVSFPRSGHEIVWHALRRYFQKPMCEYGSVLEKPEYIWARNHDHHDDFQKLMGLRHVIQYRNPVRSIVSNYHLHVNNTQQDNLEHWYRFISAQIQVWRRFASKWLIDNGIEQCLLIPYERLMHEPRETLIELFTFMSDDPIDEELVPYHDIQPRHNLDRFKYYDAEVFKHIEKELAREMAILSIPSYEAGL